MKYSSISLTIRYLTKMNITRIVQLTSATSKQLMAGLLKHQNANNRFDYRNVTTNLQAIRRFAEKVQNVQGCWKCEAVVAKNSVVCEKCGALITPDMTRNYFDLLDIQEKFDVHSSKLTHNFRQLQSVVHPDKFSNKTDLEQKNAMDWSSLLNKAYSTLSTPIKRAEYMLSIKNVSIPERNETLNPEFLMEMMERNEEIAELSTRAQCDEYLEGLKVELANLYKEFSQLLEKNQLDDALIALVRIRYVNNLEKKIKEKLYELN